MKYTFVPFGLFWIVGLPAIASAAEDATTIRWRTNPPAIRSSWDDLLEGVATRDDWPSHRQRLKQRYLELLRDDQKPSKPPLDLKIEETEIVNGHYKRLLVTYNVESDERARAYLGIPLESSGKAPAVVALHGTAAQGMRMTAGLEPHSKGNYDHAYLDQLCRRGFVVIAPEHFVSGERIPPEGPYVTERFYERHPEWTAVGKFTYEHSIAIDVLETLPEVDSQNIGAMGHSLGGHGTFFLAAYDDRIKAAAANCSASTFRDNPGVEHWARDHWYIYFKHLRRSCSPGGCRRSTCTRSSRSSPRGPISISPP
ncbi:MAG TPA: dienelactone hydrolase family protein [Pirellulales bacterium]|jgi:pimeloyl-ACP methyl ester carboxylesterase|nr:dienelactone hydrolase family protein [Pirellulales bacterium]